VLATTGAGTFRLARDWRTHGARAASRRVPRSRMDPPGAPSGSGRGEKRPASDPADASELFKRGGPKSIRASAAPRADAGNRRPAFDAEGAGDDGRRLCATNADADDDKLDGAVLEGAHARVSGETATEFASVDGGGSLSSRPRLLAKFKTLCVALNRRLSSNADNVTVAVWRSELGVAEVLRPRGKHMNRMGYVLGAQTFLFPEEIAFLVETERAALLRSKNDREPLSLRAARALCVAGHSRTNESRKISSDLYLVYAHLARRGYVVRRYGAPWNAEWKNDHSSPKRFARNKSDHAFYAGAGSVWRDDANDTTCDTIKTETIDEIDETETHIYERNANQSSNPAWYPSKRRWLTPNADETAETARDEKDFSAKRRRPTASASEGRASMCVASPAFRAYAPNGNFSKKNPGEPLFYVFLERRSEKEHSLKNGATKTKTKTTSSPSAPSFRAAAAAAAALRREVGEAHLEGKVAWASVAGGVVVLHGFEDIRQ
jgi:hypothetical protein